MKKFELVANSTIDETAAYYADNDIKCASLSFTIDGQTIKEDFGATLSFHDFFEKLRAGKMSSTAQAQVGDYLEIFRDACARGLDVVYVGFSSGLSGSFDAGRIAAQEIGEEFPERVIRCVDTLAAAGGECILVDEARKLRDRGATADECADTIEKLKLKVVHLVTVDDLNHLWRGGRVSRTSAVLGTLAGIKPVIYLDNDGKLQVCHKIRGRKKSLEYIGDELIRQMDAREATLRAMGDEFLEQIKENREQTVRISHGDCAEDAEYLANYLRERGVKNIAVRMIDTVIGSHTGPGVVALFGVGDQRRAF